MNDVVYKPSGVHTPAHLFVPNGMYMITGAAYQKRTHLVKDHRKQEWVNAFQCAAELYGWTIHAWVVLSNHYHVLVQAPEASADRLPRLVGSYHKFTARRWNVEDRQPGRQVWWNYWDTCLRSEADYLARWNYVHWNPIRHGIVARPEAYPFSSYREYVEALPGEVRRIEDEFPYGAVNDVPDDF